MDKGTWEDGLGGGPVGGGTTSEYRPSGTRIMAQASRGVLWRIMRQNRHGWRIKNGRKVSDRLPGIPFTDKQAALRSKNRLPLCRKHDSTSHHRQFPSAFRLFADN